MPTAADTPVSGQILGLPGGALNNLPPAPPMPMSAAAGTPSAFNPAMSGVPGMPTPASPIGATPAPGAYSITSYNPANLQWMYDFGAALNSARSQNKKVVVFFTAEGNRAGQTYENQYFTNPSVRQALDNFVLTKVDFSKNTRLAYSLGVFGAGVVVVVDSTGNVISRVIQLPPTPVDLLKQMAGAKPVAATTPTPAPAPAPAPAAGLPGAAMGATSAPVSAGVSATSVPL